MIDKFNKKNIPCEHFEFYPAPLDESEILYEQNAIAQFSSTFITSSISDIKSG